ncbi:MAG: RIP metalloprotease RseP [Blautia sp.]|nr:RIP metalloprotease RseP [Blautia sp.]
MSIILALLIFSAIVLFHELGHFLLAKKSGITVVEFSLGMGPRLLSTVRGGTRYSLKAFPLGGSCAMLGEDTDEVAEGSFNAASVWKRICVVAAGPVFNFILAFVFAVVIVGFTGYDPAKVVQVNEDSAAYEAGLREGDRIVRYDGYAVDLARDLYVYMYLNPLEEGKTVRMDVDRDGERVHIAFLPDLNTRYLLGFNRSDVNSMRVESLIPGLPLEDTGIVPGDTITAVNGVEIKDGADYEAYLSEHPLDGSEIRITYVHDGLEYEASLKPEAYSTPVGGFAYNTGYTRTKGFGVVKYALLEMKYMIRSTLLSLRELVTGGLGIRDLSGPVGVVDAIGQTYEQSKSEGAFTILINMLSMAILLSTNLGVMNLLPVPALDGGRLVFLFVEAVRRKPLNRNLEGSIHFTGLVLLMILMAFVMYQDILKLF